MTRLSKTGVVGCKVAKCPANSTLCPAKSKYAPPPPSLGDVKSSLTLQRTIVKLSPRSVFTLNELWLAVNACTQNSFTFREAIMGPAVTSPYCPSLDESSLILFLFFNKGITKRPEKKKRSSGDSARLQTPGMCWLAAQNWGCYLKRGYFPKEKRREPFLFLWN